VARSFFWLDNFSLDLIRQESSTINSWPFTWKTIWSW
jgi:hypothetical protein